VSHRLRSDWDNGKRYYPVDGCPLVQLPGEKSLRPSAEVLAWHNERVFLQ